MAEVVTSDPRVIVLELQRATAQLIAALAAEVVHELTVATPVATGWARSNWLPSVGVPFSSPLGSKSSVDSSFASSAAAALLATYRLSQGPVFIANNVPYIGALNNGSSRQAPSGFVERAVEKAASRFRGVVIR